MKKFPWFEAILITVVMSISLYAAFSDAQNFSRNWFVRDDAYYYFKVAQNISEGRGSTFDGSSRSVMMMSVPGTGMVLSSMASSASWKAP